MVCILSFSLFIIIIFLLRLVSFSVFQPEALAGLLKGRNQKRQKQTLNEERLQSKSNPEPCLPREAFSD